MATNLLFQARLRGREGRYPLVTHLMPSLDDAYVVDRRPTGGFLQAILENDLREACGRADNQNQRLIWEIVEYCWNELPPTCWGSPEKVAAWLAARGVADGQ